jgi:AmiR/NasT family two-component response regulator
MAIASPQPSASAAGRGQGPAEDGRKSGAHVALQDINIAHTGVKMSVPRQDTPGDRVVAADEVAERLGNLVELLRRGGHDVVASGMDLTSVRRAIEECDATLAVVSVHSEPAHALQLVETINDTASCPIVLVLEDDEPDVVRQALERGLDAYATSHTVEALDSAIALAHRRFEELESLGHQVRDLEAGAARRALIEQAKGVLMERHDIDEREAYRRLRDRARAERISLVAVAESVLRARGLLRAPEDAGPPG